MNKKKNLAAKVLKVGKGRIIFDINRLDEIKEAITKQDIRDLHSQGAIKIREIKGRRKIKKRKTKRREGKIKKTVNKRKQEHVKITRKLRKYVKELNRDGKIGKEEYKDLRKKIKAKTFRSKTHLKENIELK